METKLTDTGIEVSVELKGEEYDAFGVAANAATLTAENLEGRYGEDSELAAMFRTAARFANDVRKFSVDEQPADGQFVDVVLLGMASGWFARSLDREHNTGGDPEKYHDAAETMVDAWDSLFRSMAISAIGGQLDETEHRYSR